MVAFTHWRGSLPPVDEVVNLGPLALIEPLLDRPRDIEEILDRHLPADPQQEYSHGQVLRVLLAARLCQPTALVNVAAWAEKSGAAIFANVPADKLNALIAWAGPSMPSSTSVIPFWAASPPRLCT